MPKRRCSSYLNKNVGVLQGAILSSSHFSLHTASLSSCHSTLLKYDDDFVLCYSYSKGSNQEGLGADLSLVLRLGVLIMDLS